MPIKPIYAPNRVGVGFTPRDLALLKLMAERDGEPIAGIVRRIVSEALRRQENPAARVSGE